MTLEELSRVPLAMAFQSYLLCLFPIVKQVSQDHCCPCGAESGHECGRRTKNMGLLMIGQYRELRFLAIV